jgi:hypothetical protein
MQKKIIKGLDYEQVRKDAYLLGTTQAQKEAKFKEIAEVDFIAAKTGHGVGYFQSYCHYESDLIGAIKEYFEKGAKGSWCIDYQFTWWYIQFLTTAITVFV